MERARQTQDDDARARLVAQVGDILNEQLPWIPLANGNTLLVTDRRYTGAPASFVYMGGPWAYALGTK
jgi:peptide/nickel transport system substrate-binding protein